MGVTGHIDNSGNVVTEKQKHDPIKNPSHYELVPGLESKQIVELVLNSDYAKT